jgi:hypothetical protein
MDPYEPAMPEESSTMPAIVALAVLTLVGLAMVFVWPW